MILDPKAVFYNTPEQLQLLKNFVGERNMREIEIDINRIEQRILREVWDRINRGVLKELEEIVAKEVFKQVNEGLKKIFK